MPNILKALALKCETAPSVDALVAIDDDLVRAHSGARDGIHHLVRMEFVAYGVTDMPYYAGFLQPLSRIRISLDHVSLLYKQDTATRRPCSCKHHAAPAACYEL